VLSRQAEPEIVALSSMRANDALNLTKGPMVRALDFVGGRGRLEATFAG
jgi:hypothetical protein